MVVSLSVNWTACEYDIQRVTKYDHPSVVPPEEISGRLTGVGFALTILLWTMAWVERTTAAIAGFISAGVLKSQPGKGWLHVVGGR